MRKIMTVVAAIVWMGLGAAQAQDQSATTPATQADQQTPPKSEGAKPAVKRVAAVHVRHRPGEWYDWYYWPWNFIPDNFPPRDTHHRH